MSRGEEGIQPKKLFMDFLQIFLCTLGAYLLGSIPSAIWIGKLFYGIDIREHGNGTATHNNMLQVIGSAPSIAARILDILKGLLAAKVALMVHNQYGIFASYEYPVLTLSFGLAAIMGHIFPIFAGFRGGKGYHCSLGVFLAFNPLAAAISVGIALLIYLFSHYPNLGHIAGGFALPIFVFCTRHLYGDMLIPVVVFSIVLFLLLFISHRDLMLNFLHGNEVKLFPKLLRRQS